jgi:hypothetical protein
MQGVTILYSRDLAANTAAALSDLQFMQSTALSSPVTVAVSLTCSLLHCLCAVCAGHLITGCRQREQLSRQRTSLLALAGRRWMLGSSTMCRSSTGSVCAGTLQAHTCSMPVTIIACASRMCCSSECARLQCCNNTCGCRAASLCSCAYVDCAVRLELRPYW